MAVSAVLRCALLRRAAGAAPCRAVPRHAVCVAYVLGGRVGVSETACGRGGCLDPSPYPVPWTWTGRFARG